MARADVDESILFPDRAPTGGRRRRRRSSRFATTNRTERRLIAASAAVAAVAGAFGGVDPTGYTVSDVVLRGLFAALVALAASRARRWTWLWLAGVSAVASASIAGALPAVAALIIAFVVAATGSRRRVVGAIVGALAVQSLLRLPALDPYGWSTVVVAIAVVPLFVSAWRVCPRRVKRRVRRGALVAVAVVVAGVAVLGVAGLLAASDVEAGLRDAREGLEAARDGDDDAALTSLSSAADAFASAERTTSAWWVAPARLVPGLAQHARVLEVATSQGLAVTESGAGVAGSVDIDELRLQSGRLDLDMVEAVQQPLVDNARALEVAGAELAAVDVPLLVPPLAERVDDFREEVDAVVPEAETAAEVAAVAPGLLGGDGERRYFVVFTQPAEARGLGGFMGSWAEITAVDGDLTLSRHGRTEELRDTPDKEARTVAGPADYVERYQRFRPWVVLQDVTLSPDFPSVAEVMEQVYPQTGGGELDGVIAVDPYALAALMEFTGPITVPDLAFPLTADNAAEFLVRGQYLEFRADQATREDFLGEVTRQTFDRLTTGDLPSPREVASTLHPFVEQGRLLLWSRHAAEERLFERIDGTGPVTPRDGGDYLSVVTQNSANNKIDAFLERRVTYDAVVDPESGLVRSTARVELFNNVPSLDLPAYVIGSNDQGLPLGTNEVWFNLYTPLRFVSARVDGERASLGSQREFDLWVYHQVFRIPPGETLVVEVELEGVVAPGDYRLTVDNQPLVNADQVTLGVQGTEPWRVSGGDLAFDGGSGPASLTYEGRQDEVLEVAFRGG
jgi:hypothetical protein